MIKIFQNIFSVKNKYVNNKKYKIVTILGIKIKFLQNNISTYDYSKIFENILLMQKKQYNQSIIKDNKFPIVNSLIYIPDYPLDYIQRTIVETGNFYEINDLKYLDNFLDENSVVLDIGANIGNHTVYWGKRTNTKKIYSFEPLSITFNKLKENVKINGLEKKVNIYNIGISNICTKAKIEIYDSANTGGSTIIVDSNGEIEIKTIDSLNLEEDKISLIKIDTEGYELKVLQGAIKTINKYKPLIYVEVEKDNLKNVEEFFFNLNYIKLKQVKSTNFLFKYNYSDKNK